MGILDALFGTDGKRWTNNGKKSKRNGGRYTGIRSDSGYGVGYSIYEKSRGKGAVKEYSKSHKKKH